MTTENTTPEQTPSETPNPQSNSYKNQILEATTIKTETGGRQLKLWVWFLSLFLCLSFSIALTFGDNRMYNRGICEMELATKPVIDLNLQSPSHVQIVVNKGIEIISVNQHPYYQENRVENCNSNCPRK